MENFLFLNGNIVESYHSDPYNEEYGLVGKVEDLESKGVFYSGEIPVAEQRFGKTARMKYDRETSSVYFDYTDRPLTSEEEVILLKNAQKTASEKYQELDKESVTLEEVRAAKIAQLKEACTLAIYDGFTSASTGHTFGFNAHDQQNMDQQYLWVVSGENALADIQWKSKDAGIVTLTEEQFIAIVKEAKDHKIAQQVKYWQLEAQVLAAESTKETIDSINW